VADRSLLVTLQQDGPIPLDVEFTCQPGEVLAIFGPSGSGKTTILRSVAGLYQPSHATIRSGGDTWTDTDTGTFVPPYRRAVGLVFQEYALFPHLTAVGNVMTALGHRPRVERRDKAEALLNLVHLGGHLSKTPNELSGGERQRVALARALAREPAVLLLDEPFAAVDRSVRRRLQNQIDSLRRTLDMPLVLVTHDFEDVVRLATHVLMLEHGRAVARGPISTLMSRPDLSWLREAVGLGSVFDATVTRMHADRGLVELRFDGGALLAPARHVAANAAVRVRVPAREIVLATSAPAGLSLHNVLPGVVTAVHVDTAFEAVVVQLTVGRVVLLAEVTRDAVGRLGIDVGQHLHALIKSVSIELVASDANDAQEFVAEPLEPH
jgi:molybdate transport system ATP-binding protein